MILKFLADFLFLRALLRISLHSLHNLLYNLFGTNRTLEVVAVSVYHFHTLNAVLRHISTSFDVAVAHSNSIQGNNLNTFYFGLHIA